jgi:hypothetical protein
LTASTQELYRVKTKPKIVPIDKDDCQRLVAAESRAGKSLPRLQDDRWLRVQVHVAEYAESIENHDPV